VRLKLDENLPDDALQAAVALGHDVDTVVDEGLGGATDPEVLAAASREDRFVVTLDRGFGDVRRYPPGSHAGIAVLRVDSQDPRTVANALTTFLGNDALGDLGGCIVVVRGHLVRIRRPD
jgi:predicted nuclease of predicted toxin-antitoxin system